MRLASFNGGRIGVVVDNNLVDVTDICGIDPGAWPPVGMVQVIARFDQFGAAFARAATERPAVPLAHVRLDAPIQWPNKIVAFPANYDAHIAEMKLPGGSGVISKARANGQGFFLKANSSLSGPADPIVLPPLAGREVHHECELAIIIGKRGRGIAREQSADHIFGFTCLLDMVVRGQEERVMRKSFDTFCPIGPWIVTADEIADTANIATTLTVNGQPRQSANTRDLIVDIPEMIAMASAVMTLEPGDIIATGTPAGVGPVVDGDIVEITINGVGSMALPVRLGTLGDHTVWSAPKQSTI
jgi:2-keto-4-pentenoate hydratase/2-oxohepta-3-ene-1,7-dioic acid hydratase in catechol pathway